MSQRYLPFYLTWFILYKKQQHRYLIQESHVAILPFCIDWTLLYAIRVCERCLVLLSTAWTVHAAWNSFLVASDDYESYTVSDIENLTDVSFPLASGSKRNASWEVTPTVRLYVRVEFLGTQRCGPASYLVWISACLLLVPTFVTSSLSTSRTENMPDVFTLHLLIILS